MVKQARKRSIRYRDIADTVRSRIETGEFGAVQVLTCEATLS